MSQKLLWTKQKTSLTLRDDICNGYSWQRLVSSIEKIPASQKGKNNLMKKISKGYDWVIYGAGNMSSS